MRSEPCRPSAGRLTITPGTPLVVNRVGTWVIRYLHAGPCLATGAVLRLDVPAAFTPPQANIRWPGAVAVEPSKTGAMLALKNTPGRDTPWHNSILAELQAGVLEPDNEVICYYGAQYYLEGIARAPYFEGVHIFRVALKPSGKSAFSIAAECPVKVVGAEARRIEILLPSTMADGESAMGCVRAVDMDRNTSVQHAGTHVIESIPELSVCSPIVFKDAGNGIARLPVRKEGRGDVAAIGSNDPATGIVVRSNPIVTPSTEKYRLYWGDLHAHTNCSDGLGAPEECYDYARRTAGLDFCSLTDHAQDMSDAAWEHMQEVTKRCHAPGTFVTLLGYEVSHNDCSFGEHWLGDKNVYFPGDAAPLLRERDYGAEEYRDILPFVRRWKAEGAMMILHQHAFRSASFYDPDFVRLIEVYSCWGISEKENDIRPMFPARNALGKSTKMPRYECVRDFLGPHYGTPRGGIKEIPPLDYAQDALAKKWVLGFTGSSDDHGGRPGNTRWLRYRNGYWGGLTAVWSPELTREAVWSALWNRRCYATTGPRIIVDFRINGQPMGSVLGPLPAGEPMEFSITAHGTEDLASVTLVQDNVDTRTWSAPGASLKDTLKATCGAGIHWSYLRVTQRDGEMAWTSPIFYGTESSWRDHDHREKTTDTA